MVIGILNNAIMINVGEVTTILSFTSLGQGQSQIIPCAVMDAGQPMQDGHLNRFSSNAKLEQFARVRMIPTPYGSCFTRT